jgi:hypothetical protein
MAKVNAILLERIIESIDKIFEYTSGISEVGNNENLPWALKSTPL